MDWEGSVRDGSGSQTMKPYGCWNLENRDSTVALNAKFGRQLGVQGERFLVELDSWAGTPVPR